MCSFYSVHAKYFPWPSHRICCLCSIFLHAVPSRCLNLQTSYSCFRLHLSYYHHYLFILMRLFLNGLLTPLSSSYYLGQNSLHPPTYSIIPHLFRSTFRLLKLYCLTAHDLECLQLKDPILFPFALSSI